VWGNEVESDIQLQAGPALQPAPPVEERMKLI
jgi:hypothetical protein